MPRGPLQPTLASGVVAFLLAAPATAICPFPSTAVDPAKGIELGACSGKTPAQVAKICNAWVKSCKLLAKNAQRCAIADIKADHALEKKKCGLSTVANPKACKHNLVQNEKGSLATVKDDLDDAFQECESYRATCEVSC